MKHENTNHLKSAILLAGAISLSLAGCSTQTARLDSPPMNGNQPMSSESTPGQAQPDTRILQAAWDGKLMEILLLLDKKGVDPNIRGMNGITALSLAAQNNHRVVVKELLEHGADPNASDNKAGWFPLMWASYNGFDGIVTLLLEHGAKVNQKNSYGETALIQAAFEGRDETVRILLDHGADYNLQNDKGYSAMRAASNKGYFRIVEMLTRAGATPEADAS